MQNAGCVARLETADKALVVVRVNPARDTQWARGLGERLGKRPDVGRVMLVAGAPMPLPRAVSNLLMFERTVLRAVRPHAYRTGDLELDMPPRCDIAIDLTGSGPAPLPGAARTLCPLFDGIADDAAIYTEWDWRLQIELTILSGNPAFTLIYNSFAGLYQVLGVAYFQTTENRALSQQFYRDLRACAQSADAAAAEECVRRTMLASQKLWQQVRI